VDAPGARAIPPKSILPVYARTEVAFQLVPDAGPPRAIEPPKEGPGRLSASNVADRYAPLEVADGAGRIVQMGLGALEVGSLPAGFYRARMLLPDGVEEQLVEVPPGGAGEAIFASDACRSLVDRAFPGAWATDRGARFGDVAGLPGPDEQGL